jgi:hypothetical protein
MGSMTEGRLFPYPERAARTQQSKLGRTNGKRFSPILGHPNRQPPLPIPVRRLVVATFLHWELSEFEYHSVRQNKLNASKWSAKCISCPSFIMDSLFLFAALAIAALGFFVVRDQAMRSRHRQWKKEFERRKELEETNSDEVQKGSGDHNHVDSIACEKCQSTATLKRTEDIRIASQSGYAVGLSNTMIEITEEYVCADCGWRKSVSRESHPM